MTLIDIDTVRKTVELETWFAFAVDSICRNTFLVLRTISVETSTRKAGITGSVVTFLTTTLVPAVNITAFGIHIATSCAVTLIDVGTVVSFETVETLTSITSFSILTFCFFRTDILIETFIKIDAISDFSNCISMSRYCFRFFWYASFRFEPISAKTSESTNFVRTKSTMATSDVTLAQLA